MLNSRVQDSASKGLVIVQGNASPRKAHGNESYSL